MEPEPKRKRGGQPKPLLWSEEQLNGMSPLDYMLFVMRDPTAPKTRRDRMAIAAAPYCHPKISDQRLGKKDQREEAAETLHVGTPWAQVEPDEIRAN